MLINIFLKTIRDFTNSLIYFSIGIFLLSIVVMGVVAELPLEQFQEMVEKQKNAEPTIRIDKPDKEKQI